MLALAVFIANHGRGGGRCGGGLRDDLPPLMRVVDHTSIMDCNKTKSSRDINHG